MQAAGIDTLDRLNAGVFSVDAELKVLHWNPFMARHSGVPAGEVVGRELFACFPELPEPWLRAKLRSVFLHGAFARSSWQQRPYVFKFAHGRPLATELEVMHQDVAFLPVLGDAGVTAVCVIVTDMTCAALSRRALDHANLELAAGIAREINTPIQYVADSVSFVGEAFTAMRCIVQTYRQALYDGTRGAALEDNADLAYLEQNVPVAVDRALAGLDRIAALVRAMKEVGEPAPASARARSDLNRAITTALELVKPAYATVADLELELGDLPEVECHAAELGQVVLQLVHNAARAIAARHLPPARGTIQIRTWRDASATLISVTDDGPGIPEAIRARIFEPGFTTKPVGPDAGHGLAIARAIVVDRHAGSLTFETTPGRGTRFLVRLPHPAPGDSP